MKRKFAPKKKADDGKEAVKLPARGTGMPTRGGGNLGAGSNMNFEIPLIVDGTSGGMPVKNSEPAKKKGSDVVSTGIPSPISGEGRLDFKNLLVGEPKICGFGMDIESTNLDLQVFGLQSSENSGHGQRIFGTGLAVDKYIYKNVMNGREVVGKLYTKTEILDSFMHVEKLTKEFGMVEVR